MWSPNIWVPNHVGGSAAHTSYYGTLLCMVHPSGHVILYERLSTVLSCNMDLRYYPAETNNCYMPVTLGYTMDKIELNKVASVMLPKQLETLLTDPDEKVDKEWIVELTEGGKETADSLRYTTDFATFKANRDEIKAASDRIVPVIMARFSMTRNSPAKLAILGSVNLGVALLMLCGFMIRRKEEAVVYYVVLEVITAITAVTFYVSIPVSTAGVPIIFIHLCTLSLVEVIFLAAWLTSDHYGLDTIGIRSCRGSSDGKNDTVVTVRQMFYLSGVAVYLALVLYVFVV